MRGRGSRNIMHLPLPWSISVTPCEGVGVEITSTRNCRRLRTVTPCEGVGVEICYAQKEVVRMPVTPCEGVGVEIPNQEVGNAACPSRLARAWE